MLLFTALLCHGDYNDGHDHVCHGDGDDNDGHDHVCHGDGDDDDGDQIYLAMKLQNV